VPSQKTYREVASCSNTTDYQTRGINTKIKYMDGTSGYAHALNATALALGRTIIAIMENNQQKDGSIVVPEALRAYVGVDVIRA
jgi:seryl-tRNA synthetase